MIGKTLDITPTVIKRGKELKAVHAKAGLDDSLFVFNLLTLPETSKAVKEFQQKVAEAYDGLFASLPEKIIQVVGEDQMSTLAELAKSAVVNNPYPASVQSSAHKQNLTDEGKVTVWVVDGDAPVSKANLAAGLEME